MLVSNLGLTRFNKCEDTGAAQNGDTWGEWQAQNGLCSFDQRIGLEKCRSSSGEDRGQDPRLPVSTAN